MFLCLQRGQQPNPRTGHSLVVVPSLPGGDTTRIVLAAGRSSGNVLHADAWVLKMTQHGAAGP